MFNEQGKISIVKKGRRTSNITPLDPESPKRLKTVPSPTNNYRGFKRRYLSALRKGSSEPRN